MELEAEVENIANELRLCFNNRKAVQHSRAYRPAKRFNHPEMWVPAAQFCLKEKADPFSYVEAAFRHNTVPGGPFPQQLNSQAGVRWYRAYAKVYCRPHESGKETATPFEEEVTADIRHVMNWCFAVDGKDFTKTLMDEAMWHFQDYVRCILQPKNEAIIVKFGRSAHDQITSNPKLLEVLQTRGYDLSFLERFNNA